MSAKPKKKLCWNCEGNVSVKELMCPYCGVSLHPSTSGKEGQSDYLNPPYKLVNPAHEHHIPLPPYASEVEKEEVEEVKEVEEEEEGGKELPKTFSHHSASEASKVIIILALLIGGSIFFIFSLALLLFSDEGYFTLRWNASYWFVYLLIGLPMLIYGWKCTQALDDFED